MVKKKFITFILGIVLIFTSVFSFLFIVTKSEHSHVDNECHICLEIQTCIKFLNSISNAGVLSIFILGLLFLIYRINRATNDLRKFSTLVSLKVKLLI